MICLSITKSTKDECLNLLKQCDCAEIRLDLNNYTKAERKEIFSAHQNLIATYRPGQVTEEERLTILKEVIDFGAAMVDLEIETGDDFKEEIIKYAKEKNCKVIVSYHNYEKTPQKRELEEIIRWCFDTKADIAKIACQANSEADAAALMSLYQRDKKIVSIGMGEFGKITRIAALFLGAPFSYASMAKGQESANGQLTIESLLKIKEIIENA